MSEATVIILVLSILARVLSLDPSLISPCPSGFIYRFQDTRTNTWYGSIFITSDSDSYVIQSIRILLDSEVESLDIYDNKNPKVTVDTLDNTEYLVEGFEEKVRKTSTFSLTLAVRYKPGRNVPKLTAYRVNELTVCSHSASYGNDGHLHVREPTTSTSPPTTRYPVNIGNGQSPWTSRPAWIQPQPPPQSTPLGEECGTRIQAFTPLIVGGEDSKHGEWPWHAGLFALERQNPQYRCGASLVTRRHVVTAAHCVCLAQRSEEPLNPKELFLVLGRIQLSNWADPDSQNVKVKRILVHPGYNSTNLRCDLAVLRLEEPVKITPYVRPLCLWSQSTDLKLLIQRKGTVIGWGYTQAGTVSDLLQHAEIPVIHPFDCVSKNREFYLQYLSEKSYCAGSIQTEHSTTKQACNGDSGGGMVFPRPGTDIWELRGVVSLAARGDGNMCDLKLYMVFTDIAYYLDWINQSINSL